MPDRWSVVQLAERLTVNQVVGGSTPLAPANYCRVDKLVKSPVSETGVFVGSKPTSASNLALWCNWQHPAL